MTEDGLRNDGRDARIRRHLRFGWLSLLCFLVLGLALEGLHGLKLRWYLDAGNDTRRLLLTLGHAHGSLLGLVHIAYAASIAISGRAADAWPAWTSGALAAASLLLPGGFLLGGLFIHGGDPGLGIVLAPIGGLLLCGAVARIAWAFWRSDASEGGI